MSNVSGIKFCKYVSNAEIHEASRSGKVQVWVYNGVMRSLRQGNTILKSEFGPVGEMEEAVTLLRALGGKGWPSSYGDIYHRLFRSPVIPVSVSYNTAGRVPAGWQQAPKRGPLQGSYRVYDIVSAYGWAGMQRLPWIRSAKPSDHVEPGGLYIITFTDSGAVRPPNMAPGHPVLASTEEIERYDLRGVQVQRGVRFRSWCSLESNLEKVKDTFSFWKKIWRAYWGAWIASRPIVCQIMENGRVTKAWSAERPSINAPWAYYITAAVRQRIAEYAGEAAHIYVDSVMLPREIRTGSAPGDWALKETLTNPVIFGAGRYADAGGMVKQSGVPKVKLFKPKYYGKILYPPGGGLAAVY